MLMLHEIFVASSNISGLGMVSKRNEKVTHSSKEKF